MAVNYKTIYMALEPVPAQLDVKWGIARIADRKLQHNEGAQDQPGEYSREYVQTHLK